MAASRWLLRATGALIVALSLACGHGGGGASAPAPTGAPTPVRVLAVSTTTGASQVAATGTVVAEDSAVIRPESTGPVEEIHFGHGQRVAKGDVLVRLRDAEARAAVAEAEARLALAEAQLGRTKGLVERQNASQADLDRADADRDLADAQLARAREALRKTVVRAPFDWVVGLREVAPGEVIDPSRVVTRLESLDRVAIDIAVPERELPQVTTGLPATVTLDALPASPIDGEVVFVGPRVDATSRTATVRVRVANPDGRLRPGMTARVSLTAAEIADAIRVPTQAVLTTARGSSVYVVDGDGVAQLRPVRTADRSADTVRVVEGLSVGDRVVVEGLVRLRPGAKVQVLDEAAQATAEAE